MPEQYYGISLVHDHTNNPAVPEGMWAIECKSPVGGTYWNAFHYHKDPSKRYSGSGNTVEEAVAKAQELKRSWDAVLPVQEASAPDFDTPEILRDILESETDYRVEQNSDGKWVVKLGDEIVGDPHISEYVALHCAFDHLMAHERTSDHA